MTLLATTVNVYSTPFVRLEMMHDVVVTAHPEEAGLDVTSYCVMGLPPSLLGALHETVARASEATAAGD
jgi:hypothetical protein